MSKSDQVVGTLQILLHLIFITNLGFRPYFAQCIDKTVTAVREKITWPESQKRSRTGARVWPPLHGSRWLAGIELNLNESCLHAAPTKTERWNQGGHPCAFTQSVCVKRSCEGPVLRGDLTRSWSTPPLPAQVRTLILTQICLLNTGFKSRFWCKDHGLIARCVYKQALDTGGSLYVAVRLLTWWPLTRWMRVTTNPMHAPSER